MYSKHSIKYPERWGVIELPEHIHAPIGTFLSFQAGTDEFDRWCPYTQGVIVARDDRVIELRRGFPTKPLYFVAVRDDFGISLYEGVNIKTRIPLSTSGILLKGDSDLKNHLRSYRSKGDNVNLVRGRFELLRNRIDILPLTEYQPGAIRKLQDPAPKLLKNYAKRYSNKTSITLEVST